MKKLILLLFIPLVFACSSDDSNSDSQTLKEYLTSNIFVNSDNDIFEGIEYDNERFIEFIFEEGIGNGWNYIVISNIPTTICPGYEETWDSCIHTSNQGDGFIIGGGENSLIWEETSSEHLYEIVRTGNDIVITRNSFSTNYVLTTQDYLNQKKAERDNIICLCSY